ncbi:MAG TPA: MscL family protein [Thermoplasmata archaeon]|nr:MscL family protein [Thermoplasmata archaeon]
MDDFKNFVIRGNAVDMAVGIVIGSAFTALITAIVNGVLLPLISIPGSTNYASWKVTVGHGIFLPGTVLTALITLIVVALVIFFAVVRPLAHLAARRAAKQAAAAPTTKECPDCLSQIPLKAHKCMYCTSAQPMESAST